jgi:hypothetical protein
MYIFNTEKKKMLYREKEKSVWENKNVQKKKKGEV